MHTFSIEQRSLLERWYQALTSGEYKEIKAVFKTTPDEGEERFCAMGVLLDILDPTAWDEHLFLGRPTMIWNNAEGSIPERIGLSAADTKMLTELGTDWNWKLHNGGYTGVALKIREFLNEERKD